MFKYQTTDVAALIKKSGDSPEVQKVKEVIATMLTLDPMSRPSIQEVVEKLSRLRTELGVQVVTLDTVWKPVIYGKKPVLYSNKPVRYSMKPGFCSETPSSVWLEMCFIW